METAEIVEVFENMAWVEHDIMGDAHVMLQSAAPGSEPKCVVTVRYAYPYIDNATRDQVATRVAEMFGAVKPVEFRFRELQPNTNSPTAESD
jgi:hypothetical protein